VLEPAESADVETTSHARSFVNGAQPLQAAKSAATAPLAIDALLLRMRGGDRDAAAEFLMRYGSRIRRRIRGKLGPSIRRLFDSLEILSTLGRRLDLYVMSGRMQAANEGQLWSLLFKMADNALIDKARLFRRLQSVEGEDSEFAQQLGGRLQQAETEQSSGVELEIDNCLRAIPDPTDRRILSLWLTGEPHISIAEHVELAPTAVRKRWENIKSQLKERLQTVGA
jgi:hypothetical protein